MSTTCSCLTSARTVEEPLGVRANRRPAKPELIASVREQWPVGGSDCLGAKARFEAVHAAGAASAQQRRYAAYYLATMAWYEGDYDVARVQFREAKEHADASTAQLASQMLQSHWGE